MVGVSPHELAQTLQFAIVLYSGSAQPRNWSAQNVRAMMPSSGRKLLSKVQRWFDCLKCGYESRSQIVYAVER